MEKDNKSVPMRVFSNTMSNYTLETKSTSATSSILQNVSHRQHHTIHPRLQMCPNEIIDLTSAAAAHETATATTIAMVNLNSQAYELSKINAVTAANMMSVYDVNNSNMVNNNNFVEISPAVNSTIANNLDILKGISKGK